MRSAKKKRPPIAASLHVIRVGAGQGREGLHRYYGEGLAAVGQESVISEYVTRPSCDDVFP